MRELLLSIRRYPKVLIERAFNVSIYRVLPRGVDPLRDLKALTPGYQPRAMFDVGANVGQSAVRYARRLPEAKIFSFEPAAETFLELKQNVSAFPGIQCFNIAFGAQPGLGSLEQGISSEMNRLFKPTTRGASVVLGNPEVVRVETIDGFCANRAIERIDYLKIDTEGADLDVLRGAERMLRSGLIDVIEVEVGIGVDNERHVPFAEFCKYLEPRGYQVFGFYEQVHEWRRQLPHLRRANVVFVSRTLDQLGCVTD